MKKGEFDLTGKAVDCRDLPAMGDAGKEIFRVLKVVFSGSVHPSWGQVPCQEERDYLMISDCGKWQVFGSSDVCRDDRLEIIQPSDVLGQAAIDAAIEGSTIVFEGDSLPVNIKVKTYHKSGDSGEGYIPVATVVDGYNPIIAYKIIEESDINARVLAEKVGSKHDQGKPRYDLIPVHAEAEFVDVLTFGATKYAPNQWRDVEDARERYTAAAMRHLAAYRMGETHDIESGKHHLAHAMCCMAFNIELDLEQE